MKSALKKHKLRPVGTHLDDTGPAFLKVANRLVKRVCQRIIRRKGKE